MVIESNGKDARSLCQHVVEPEHSSFGSVTASIRHLIFMKLTNRQSHGYFRGICFSRARRQIYGAGPADDR